MAWRILNSNSSYEEILLLLFSEIKVEQCGKFSFSL